jgi:hypothetical protein
MRGPLQSEFSLTRTRAGLGEALMDDRPTIVPRAPATPVKASDASRETRRALALRANLRRRKAGAKNTPTEES